MSNQEITGRTRVFAHVAHPSAHVVAPQIFNDLFRKRRIDAVTVSIDVAPAHLHALIEGLRGWANLIGMGVTMPHKGAAALEVDELVGVARHVRTINVVRRDPDGRLIGINTDGVGFVQGLLSQGRDPVGKKALLIGTGGAGRAIAFALAERGVSTLALANRTREKAEQLASEIRDTFPGATAFAADPDPSGYDLVVNATTLGMHADDPLPLDINRIELGTVVAEIVVAVPKTALIAEAEHSGHIVHPGMHMVAGQLEQVMRFLGLQEESSS